MAANPLICLIGLHGTGKTTIARNLVSLAGYKAVSVGDIGRLARKGRLPNDVPSTLMVLLARIRPGAIIDDATAKHLTSYLLMLRETSPVVVDGFPACANHVRHLDSDCLVAHITVSDGLRERRLSIRSEQTPRKWTPGGVSARDLALDGTVMATRESGVPCASFSNDGESPSRVAHMILHWTKEQL